MNCSLQSKDLTSHEYDVTNLAYDVINSSLCHDVNMSHDGLAPAPPPPRIFAPYPAIRVRIYNDIISKPSVRIAVIIIYLIVILIATIGNILVILVIYRRRSLHRNPAILLILNLAFCDLISCVVYRPLLLVELFLPFTSMELFSDQLNECKAASYFQGLLAGVGFHSMVLISQERLLLIVYPLKAKVICTYSRTIKMLAAIWLLASLSYLPVPILFEEIRKFRIDGTMLSFCGYYSGSTMAIVYFSCIFGFYFVIPLVLITIAYAKIFKVLYQRMEELNCTPSTGGIKSLNIRRKLAKMMLAVSIIFALCWGPNFTFFLWVACGLGVRENGFFAATVVEFLPLISSAINPFIYTLNSKTFQSGLKRLLCARFCRSQLEDSSLYRSFNSLHIPQNGLLSGHAVHRNSTFQGRCQRSVSMPMGTIFHYSNHNSPCLHAKRGNTCCGNNTNLSLYAHARRNTFVSNDWQASAALLDLTTPRGREALRNMTSSNTSINAQRHYEQDYIPGSNTLNVPRREHPDFIKLKTIHSSKEQ